MECERRVAGEVDWNFKPSPSTRIGVVALSGRWLTESVGIARRIGACGVAAWQQSRKNEVVERL